MDMEMVFWLIKLSKQLIKFNKNHQLKLEKKKGRY